MIENSHANAAMAKDYMSLVDKCRTMEEEIKKLKTALDKSIHDNRLKTSDIFGRSTEKLSEIVDSPMATEIVDEDTVEVSVADENLNRLNQNKIKFITIRHRGKNLVERINSIPAGQWKKIRVPRANGKGRTVRIYEERVKIKGYEGEIRQICITGHGKIKPAIIITNEFDLSAEEIVRRYSRRWLVEKGISEQIEFFHLNRNSSGMVIKVDFDLTMTILAHNIYRIFALQLDGYSHCADHTIFEKFIQNAGEVVINGSAIEVRLKKKRTLPLLLEQMNDLNTVQYSWLSHMKLLFAASTTT
jgi:hypothetical protein